MAIELMQLIDFRTGDLRYKSYEELCEKFGIQEGSQIVVSGTADDPPLEKYWLARNPAFFKNLNRLKVVLVTTPNFSSFVNAPRWTDMYNMKRIGICWTEFALEGIPTALHLNARTNFDWQRLAEWIIEREEICSLAFEFATLIDSRKAIYVRRLVELANSVPRRLQLVVRGGIRFLSTLANSFDLVYLDTEPFIKANRRQMAVEVDKWVSVASPNLIKIDQLLEHNVQARARRVLDAVRPLSLEP